MLRYVAAVGIAALVFVFYRRRYLSKLSDIPGPFIASFSVLWQVIHIIKGDIDRESSKLHDQYGKCFMNVERALGLATLC